MKTFEEYFESTFSDSEIRMFPGRNSDNTNNKFNDKQTKVYQMYISELEKHIGKFEARRMSYELTKNGYSNIESVKKIVDSYVDPILSKDIMASIKTIHPQIKLLQR